MTKMKIGNFFEISGITSTTEARNIRASLQYFSKKENVKVMTSFSGSVLRVERIKSSKTKESNRV
jgi:ABC-type molybdate transport system substrate-binding protein